MTISDGSNLGPFRILGPPGRGGMASVYKAFEPGLDRTVAVKVLPAEYLHDPNFAERFRREAQVIAKLEHPHIVPIYAYGIDQGVPWMSMRLVPGGSLYSLLKAKEGLGHGVILKMLAGVASALDYAHAAGVIHRDVKPQNILIDEHQHVYLADFGIAKMVEGAPGLTQTGMITGTPQYMAPEQALGSKIDRRADIYSLGVVAYECFTGRVPFTADTPLAVLMKHVRDPIPLPSVSEVPEHQCTVLMKALAKAPADRWPTATGFVEAMKRAETTASTLQESPTLVATTMKSPPPLPGAGRARTQAQAATTLMPARSSGPIVGGIAVAALLALVAGGYLVFQAARQPPAPTPQPTEAARQPGPVSQPQPVEAPAVDTSSTTPAPATATPPPVTATPAAVSATAAPVRARGAGVPPLPATTARETPGAEGRVTTATTPPPAAPPAAEPAAAPVAPPPPRAAAPERPRGLGFALGTPIALGDLSQSLITLRTVTFKFNPKNAELQAEVAGHCGNGEDYAVDIQLALLDQAGDVLATLKGRGSIEEGDDGKIRTKQHLTQSVVSSITSFRLTFQARPD